MFFSNSGASGGDVFRQMIDAMPVNVMLCDLTDFRITYLNKQAQQTFQQIEHILPVKAHAMLGQSIDIFHKNPSHQRRLLSDPNRLPHNTRIHLGDEVLDLLVTACRDKSGRYTGPMVTWNRVTEQIRQTQETEKLLQMVESMPINVMLADLESFKITYLNKASVDTLRTLERHLPVRANQVVGQTIDIFHKNPHHQRRLLKDPSNLPYQATIRLGNEVMNLKASAIYDNEGRYVGAMVNWSLITANSRLADGVQSVSQTLTGSLEEMTSTAQVLSKTAEETNQLASVVAAASEELSKSVTEISGQVSQAAEIASNAVEETERSNAMVSSLAEAAERIGEVVKLISDIASQTNLLALNATIEAARAGDAGKGFAVVASEVKSLANQTAKATDDISAQVQAIQDATQTTVEAIQGIGQTINQVSEVATSISSSVEEQAAATDEVARNIVGVTEASASTGESAGSVLSTAESVGSQARDLEKQIASFLEATMK